MKIQEIFEAVKPDQTEVIDQLEKTKAFESISKRFFLKSTKIQRKNGTLLFETLPEVIKSPREFLVNSSAQMKVRNVGTSIWQNAGTVAGYHTMSPLEMYEAALARIEKHFDEWFQKRLTSAKTDASNLKLYSLEDLGISPSAKPFENFSCQSNHLITLEGLPPLKPDADLYASDNELVSPLVGAPKEIGTFNVRNNKLTSFEGFPTKAKSIYIEKNPFTSFKDVEKYVKECKTFCLPALKAPMLQFFKVKGCERIIFDQSIRNRTDDYEMFNSVAKILNKHLQSDRDILECQDELINAGFEEFARVE